MSEKDEKEFTKQEWVVRRLTKLTTGKDGVAFLPFRDGKLTDETLAFERKRGKSWIVGGVYQVEALADGSVVRIDTARYLRTYQHPDVAGWQAEAQAEALVERAKKLEANAANAEIERSLGPLRLTYHRLSSAQRIAFEVRILAYLRMTKV